MKWIYRIVTLGLLLVLIGAPFFLRNKQGEPMLTFPTLQDLIPSQAPVPDALTPAAKIYKWQDDAGQWHFGDEPPAGQTVTEVTVDTNVNILMSPRPPEPAAENIQAPTDTAGNRTGEDVLSPQKALNILQEAQQAKALMEQRNQSLDHSANQ